MGLLVRARFYFDKKGKGGLVLGGTTALSHNRGSGFDPQGSVSMVILVEVELKQIVEQQRAYPWPRPVACPRCQECRLWGHGFVLAFFDGPSVAVYLKRFRCPGCRCVIRLRPKGYFARFQASIQRIYACLRRRIINGRYDTGLSRSRQRHWMRALQRQVAAYLGEGFRSRLLEGFSTLMQRGRVPVASNLAF
jgi:hypothetical protein